MFGRNYSKENLTGNIGIAQLNFKAGDFEYNSEKIAECIRYAESLNLDMVVFPELSIVGFSIDDTIERHPVLVDENIKWLEGLAKITKNTAALVGFIDKEFKNSAALLRNGKIEKINPSIYSLNGTNYGINIGKNILNNCDVIINLWSTPSRTGKEQKLKKYISEKAIEYKTPIIYVNQVGATDNISFDGSSFAVNADGEIFAQAKAFEEDFIVVNPQNNNAKIKPIEEIPDEPLKYTDFELERTYKTIIQGIKDYFGKCGLKRAVLGLSGGLDSTVCAVLLSDALGKENVVGVSMPSKLTSNESKSDARELAENLGIHFSECSIKPMFDTTTECLSPLFDNIEQVWNNRYKKSFTPDNIQARARATYLWCVSNEFPSCIPIATSDKSESYMGYATINGDMSGGFAPIADVTKTKLFALAKWLNKNREEQNAIPESVILKRPGAELAIDPKTGKTLCAEDALMPYEFLDEVIWRIENRNQSYKDLLNADFVYERNNKISKKQKTEWLDKFFKRMSTALYKWSIMPPAVIVDTHSINKFEYSQPVTSCSINYKGKTREEINSILCSD